MSDRSRSSSRLIVWAITLLLAVGAVALTLQTNAALQAALLSVARRAIAAVIGGDGLAKWTPLLLKLAFFAAMATLVWGGGFLRGADRRRTLLDGVVTAGVMAVGLEALQAVLSHRQASPADALWCAGTGCLTAGVLFAGQWAAVKFPKLVNRQTVLYVVFGVLTTLVNIVSFQLFYNLLHIPALITNAIAWVLSVLVAYITNKRYVFESRTGTAAAFWREIGMFFGARLLSFGVDEAGIWLLIDVVGLHSGLSKILMNVVVLILNYIFSKWFIFKKNKE
ncbi:MAG: GtrA family protein [Acutalibacteraceae bacterium]|jgi:putative flippase GtrA